MATAGIKGLIEIPYLVHSFWFQCFMKVVQIVWVINYSILKLIFVPL